MSKLYPEHFFSVLERNTVKCPRGSFIENAMCNVNDLGWGCTFFPWRASRETNTGLDGNVLQGSTACGSRDWQKDHEGFNPKCPLVPPSCSLPEPCECVELEEITNFLGATRDCISITDPYSARY